MLRPHLPAYTTLIEPVHHEVLSTVHAAQLRRDPSATVWTAVFCPSRIFHTMRRSSVAVMVKEYISLEGMLPQCAETHDSLRGKSQGDGWLGVWRLPQRRALT